MSQMETDQLRPRCTTSLYFKPPRRSPRRTPRRTPRLSSESASFVFPPEALRPLCRPLFSLETQPAGRLVDI